MFRSDNYCSTETRNETEKIKTESAVETLNPETIKNTYLN
jgi:hypothetical protein